LPIDSFAFELGVDWNPEGGFKGYQDPSERIPSLRTCWDLGSISPICLGTDFTLEDPKSAKRQSFCTFGIFACKNCWWNWPLFGHLFYMWRQVNHYLQRLNEWNEKKKIFSSYDEWTQSYLHIVQLATANPQSLGAYSLAKFLILFATTHWNFLCHI